MKRNSIYLILFLMIFGVSHAQDVQTASNVQPEFIINESENVVTIDNQDFEKFLKQIVHDALKYGKHALLSQALLRCYEGMSNDQKTVYREDLKEALPELLSLAALYCQERNEVRAPRPGQPFQNNEIVGPNAGDCDLGSVIQLLNQLLKALNKCCATLQSDFQETWTILANLGVSSTAIVDITGIFTALADIDATLTACCENTTREFQETWSILANLTITVSSSPCSATPILAPTTISVPGSYCLANDIVGTLIITADNVTVNLNNHTISAPGASAIIITGNRNVIVDNGKIDNASTGVQVVTTETIQLSNLLITNCSASGISFAGTNQASKVQDVIIDTCQVGGFTGSSVNSSFLSRITVTRTPIPFEASGSSNIIEDVVVVDCGSNFLSAVGIFINGGTNNQVLNCSVNNFQGVGGIFVTSSQSVVRDCVVQNLFFSSPAGLIGILLGDGTIGNDTILMQNSSVINIQSTALALGGATGIVLDASNITLENCLVQTCSSFSNFNLARGIAADTTVNSCNFLNCKAYNSGYGFSISSGGSSQLTFLNCEAAYNSIDGFFINNVTTLIGECVAFDNAGAGFNIAAVGTTPMYGCFASNNGTNYVNSPNVQNANTTVAVFARGNNFI